MKRLAVLPLAVLIGFGASRAEAGSVADVPAVQTANGSSFRWREVIGAGQSATVGWSFTVGAADVQVTALGFYDDGMNGDADAHPVGLWTSDATLLAQTIVPAGTAGDLVGSYRYVGITPVTLSAGQTYFVGAYFGPVIDRCVGGECGDFLLAFGTETYDPRIAFQLSRQNRAIIGPGTLAFPGIDAEIAEGFFGPNLLLAATAPAVGLSASNVGFGSLPVGQAAVAQTVTVTNTGGSALNVGALAIGGAQAAEFGLANDTCSNQSVAPAGNCTFDVGFTPAAPGARLAQVSIPSDAASTPDVVSLSGTGLQAQVALTPDPLAFGNVLVGATAAQDVTVANAGNGVLSVSAITAATGPFAQIGGSCGTVPFTVAASGSCTLTYVFGPTAAGSATQLVTVTSNAAAGSDDQFTLQGTGVEPIVDISPASHDFGTTSPASATFTVTNVGDGNLVIGGLDNPGSPFAITGGSCTALPATVAPSASCTIVVEFAPTSAGNFQANLGIESNAPSSPDTITLTGGLSVAAVPALDPWGLGALAVLLGWSGWRLTRRVSRG